jgi:predicted transcriptional regulator
MLLTEEQANERLNSEKNLANRFSRSDEGRIEERVINRPGKEQGLGNLSPEAKNEIAIRSRLGESQVALANEFGVTQPTVSYIERGKTKTDEEKVESAINQVRDKALERLMHSLGLITDDKLSGCSAKDLSTIASNMSRVVEKTIPRAEVDNKINLVIYAPELRQEKSFKTIEI